jgi:hypothetical protein
MLLPKYAIEVSNLKDRLEAGEITTQEYNRTDGKKNKFTTREAIVFDDLEARQHAQEEADILTTMGRLFDAVGGYFADTWEAEEEDYYLSRYDESNL